MQMFDALCLAELYDGTGRHVAGYYPPLAINNVLTDVHRDLVATRPAWRKIAVQEPEGANLGLVWMVPLGLEPLGQIPDAVIGALVQAVDTGHGIIIHADRDDTAATVAGMVKAFAGGGHA